MANKLQEMFNPTLEQLKRQYEFINKLIRQNLEKKGKDCTNCKHHKDIQQSPYYDYTTCKFDGSIELPGGLDYRHCCDRYEFMGFLEVDQNDRKRT